MRRLTFAIRLMAVLAFAIPVAAEETVILTEDFESGLGAWTTMVYGADGGPNNNDPLVFDGPDGTGIFGPNTGYPGSTSVGFASDLDPWDGQQPQWIQKQWEGALAPGIYHVTLTVDRYVYTQDNHDPWGLGNRIYVLTDTLYDDPVISYDNNPFPPTGLEGDGIRSSLWSGNEPTSPNGVWDIGATIVGDLDTTTGNIELRLLMHEKYSGQVTCAWDNVALSITDSGGGEVFSYTDDFEDGLDGWEGKLYGPEPNDTPQTFTADDPLLYHNRNNPGSTSGGYSSNLPARDTTEAAWMQQQFPQILGPGMFDVVFEFDAYVYKLPEPNNDMPMLFWPDGTGMYGDNTPYSGQSLSQSVGFSSNLDTYDETQATWLQQQHPAAIDPGTYDVHLEADVYVYKDANNYDFGNRIYFLTDGLYGDQEFGPDGDTTPGFRKSTWNQDGGTGTWIHIDEVYPAIATTSGNLEFRLLMHDKQPGPQTTAWDNVRFTFTDSISQEVAFELFDDFEAGYDDWSLVPRGGDPWGVGNRVYVLTDDLYDDPTFNFDTGIVSPGFTQTFWPGWQDEPAQQFWNNNGLWQHVRLEKQMTTLSGNVEVRLLMHDKHTGAQAVAWDNVSLSVSIPELPCNDPWYDYDDDGDVDQDDFAVFQACYTGPNDMGGTFDPEVCLCMDPDNDSDVDSADLVVFEACASGPDIPAEIGCDKASCDLPGGTCMNLAPAACIARGGTPGEFGSTCP